MVELTVIRHGPTAWTEAGRIQGQHDEPLSPAGRDAVPDWHLPPHLADQLWVSSPLRRCCETAALLGHTAAAVEPRLIEMHWGSWEGRTLADLRRALGPAFKANERRGLDFRPVAGESPREVQRRLAPWLAAVAMAGRATVAVSHKGVIRALYAMASGWDMVGAPVQELAWDCAHGFAVASDGTPRVARLNIPMTGSTPR